MSSYYIEAIVHQTIPCECVKPVEAWLLTRLFKTKIRHVQTKIRHDRFCFSAGWMLDDLDQGAFSSDGKLTKALAASRKVCPELCAEVEHEIDNGGNIRLSMIDYKKIFQSIVRRQMRIPSRTQARRSPSSQRSRSCNMRSPNSSRTRGG